MRGHLDRELITRVAFFRRKSPQFVTSVLEKVRRQPGGLLGLYRGILPGSLSVFLRNGAAMLVMGRVNEKIDQWGWRR